MRLRCTILLFAILLSAGAGGWAGIPDTTAARMRIDSLEKKGVSFIYKKHEFEADSMSAFAVEILSASRRAGDAHGIAVALAMQSFVSNMKANDFPRSEDAGAGIPGLVWSND